MRHRDVWPDRNTDGSAHWAGTDCPCAPWSFWGDDGAIVVVHQWFHEQIIHTSEPESYDDAVMDEVEWEIQQ